MDNDKLGGGEDAWDKICSFHRGVLSKQKLSPMSNRGGEEDVHCDPQTGRREVAYTMGTVNRRI